MDNTKECKGRMMVKFNGPDPASKMKRNDWCVVIKKK